MACGGMNIEISCAHGVTWGMIFLVEWHSGSGTYGKDKKWRQAQDNLTACNLILLLIHFDCPTTIGKVQPSPQPDPLGETPIPPINSQHTTPDSPQRHPPRTQHTHTRTCARRSCVCAAGSTSESWLLRLLNQQLWLFISIYPSFSLTRLSVKHQSSPTVSQFLSSRHKCFSTLNYSSLSRYSRCWSVFWKLRAIATSQYGLNNDMWSWPLQTTLVEGVYLRVKFHRDQLKWAIARVREAADLLLCSTWK